MCSFFLFVLFKPAYRFALSVSSAQMLLQNCLEILRSCVKMGNKASGCNACSRRSPLRHSYAHHKL